MIQQIIIIAHVLVCVLMVAIILLQQGKGAEAGASFGSGGSQTVLGAAGSVSLLTRFTTFLAVLFFGLSFALAYYASDQSSRSTKIEINAPAAIQVPEQATNSDVPVANTAPAATTDVPAVSSDVPAANSDVPAVPSK